MLYYFPIEPYEERYTFQLSSKGGWFESALNKFNIPYKRVEGQRLNKEIKIGSVLDACGRGYWASSQVMKFLELLNNNKIKDQDTVFIEDFWHPGYSALPYARHLTGVNFKIYSYVWAQSVDPFDFTYPMRDWMRHFEIGEAKTQDGIFVTSTCLRDSLLYAGIKPKEDIFVVGLPFDSKEVLLRSGREKIEKQSKLAVFTSRWDREKRPDVFLKIVDEVLEKDPKFEFVITTSRSKQRSNDESLMGMLKQYLRKYPKNLFLKEGISKQEYYGCLKKAQYQINTADQDFVSFTLLESTTFGCIPVYPYFLSFPEVFKDHHEFMYQKNNPKDAAKKILDFQGKKNIDVSWIYKPFDNSIERMFKAMKLISGKYKNLYEK